MSLEALPASGELTGVDGNKQRPGGNFLPLYSAPVEIDQSHLVREPFQVAYALERGDDRELAAKLRIEERELEAGGLN